MYNEYKVKPFIFAGRKPNLEILFPLLTSPIIDEILVGVNTNNITDVEFIQQYAKTDTRIKLINIPSTIIRTVSAYSYMFSQMTDEDTIYVKIDDDILYLSDNFFEQLIQFRYEHPEFLLVYPFIVNNPWCNYLGRFLASRYDNPSDVMYHSWADAKIAYFLLRAFAEGKLSLTHIANSIIDASNTFYRHEINDIVRPNINVIAFFGKDNYNMGWHSKMRNSRSDEYYLVHDIYNDPSMHRKSIIYTKPVAVHYAFCRQSAILNQLDVLAYYKNRIG